MLQNSNYVLYKRGLQNIPQRLKIKGCEMICQAKAIKNSIWGCNFGIRYAVDQERNYLKAGKYSIL